MASTSLPALRDRSVRVKRGQNPNIGVEAAVSKHWGEKRRGFQTITPSQNDACKNFSRFWGILTLLIRTRNGPKGGREIHIVTVRPNTEPKPTPSVLKNWETEVRFSSGFGLGLGVSVEPYFLSPMIGERERDGARDGGGERDTQRQRQR